MQRGVASVKDRPSLGVDLVKVNWRVVSGDISRAYVVSAIFKLRLFLIVGYRIEYLILRLLVLFGARFERRLSKMQVEPNVNFSKFQDRNI